MKTNLLLRLNTQGDFRKLVIDLRMLQKTFSSSLDGLLELTVGVRSGGSKPSGASGMMFVSVIVETSAGLCFYLSCNKRGRRYH